MQMIDLSAWAEETQRQKKHSADSWYFWGGLSWPKRSVHGKEYGGRRFWDWEKNW